MGVSVHSLVFLINFLPLPVLLCGLFCGRPPFWSSLHHSFADNCYASYVHFGRQSGRWTSLAKTECIHINALNRASFISTVPLYNPLKSRLCGLIFAGNSQNILIICVFSPFFCLTENCTGIYTISALKMLLFYHT